MSIQFSYAARSDVGYVRAGKENQDSGYAGPNLLVLADGMGGAAGGEIASSVVIAHLMHLDEVQNAASLVPLLRSALEGAHREIQEISTANPRLQGLGTTCVALLRAENKIAMAHIGDSRAYVLHNNRLTQVTHDHSFVQILVDQGKITQDEAEYHPKRNVIMRTLGDSQEELQIDLSVRTANPGDRWLLCSDGLSGVISRETIEETIIESATPAQAADLLIEITLKAGAPDNVTVIVCDVLSSDSSNDKTIPNTDIQVVGAATLEKTDRNHLSPAAKAAALSRKVTPEITPEEDEEKTNRLAFRAALGGLVVALVLVLAWFGYSWTQQQFFISTKDDTVAIYKGVPWDLGPIKLSEIVEKTGPELKDLSAAQRQAVLAGIPQSSLSRARQYVAQRLVNIEIEKDTTPSQPPSAPTSSQKPNGGH